MSFSFGLRRLVGTVKIVTFGPDFVTEPQCPDDNAISTGFKDYGSLSTTEHHARNAHNVSCLHSLANDGKCLITNFLVCG